MTTNPRPNLAPRQPVGWSLIITQDLPKRMRLIVSFFLVLPFLQRQVPVLQERMKIFLGIWILVLPMVCLNFWSPKANVWSPEVMDLTITSFDYVATNVVGSQNMMQSLSSVSSSKLSQWPPLTENTRMTKFCVNKCFLSLALNITTCDAGVQKQSWMSCITEEMNDKKNQQECKAESCDSSTKFSFILNCCVLFSLLALEQTMNRNITVLIRFCAYC